MKVVRDKVIIPMVFYSLDQRGKVVGRPEGVGADVIEDGSEVGVQGGRGVGVCVAQVFDVFGEVAEEEDVLLADFAGYFDLGRLVSGRTVRGGGGRGSKGRGKGGKGRGLTLAPSQVPMMRPPLRTNFMLLVPEASVPAVEMCSLTSLAGMMTSALLTL